jgi:hypothetical protein
MKIIISLAMVLLPCTTFASTDCRVVEYPDHYEAICNGDSEKTPAPYQRTEQEPIVASAETTEPELLDVPPEKIVRNELAMVHGAAWLKSKSSR